MVKNVAFRRGSAISVDEKVYMMRLIKGSGVFHTWILFYPRVFGLHDIPENVFSL